MTDPLNDWTNDKGDCRLALATTGLLNIYKRTEEEKIFVYELDGIGLVDNRPSTN